VTTRYGLLLLLLLCAPSRGQKEGRISDYQAWVAGAAAAGAGAATTVRPVEGAEGGAYTGLPTRQGLLLLVLLLLCPVEGTEGGAYIGLPGRGWCWCCCYYCAPSRGQKEGRISDYQTGAAAAAASLEIISRAEEWPGAEIISRAPCTQGAQSAR
jgi:hypothetical protein